MPSQAEQNRIAKELINDELFSAYWDSVAHFHDKDLVIIYNMTEPRSPVSAKVRTKMLSHPDAPPTVVEKLQKAPSTHAKSLKSASTSFWFVVIFEDDDIGVTPINAEWVPQSGTA